MKFSENTGAGCLKGGGGGVTEALSKGTTIDYFQRGMGQTVPTYKHM